MESNLGLLDESSSLESIIEDFKLLDSQVSVHLDYDTFDPYASGREAGHLGKVLSGGVLTRRNDKVSLLLSRITIGFPRKATRSVTPQKGRSILEYWTS